MIQTEHYEGMCFEVACFTNRDSFCLPLENEKGFTRFSIRLWDLLKYISISYVFENICDKIRKNFEPYIKNSENYFEICRDIFIDIKINDDNDRIIFCSLQFSDRLLDILEKELEIPSDEAKKIKKALYDEIIVFLKKLFKNEIFCNKHKKDKTSQIIKKAFEDCIMESITDVKGAFWLNYWSESCYPDSIIWEEYNEDIVVKDSNYNQKFFDDKKIYTNLISCLSYKSKPRIMLSNMIHDSGQIRIYGNIEKTCEKLNKTNTVLYNFLIDNLDDLIY